jgi:site-specific DNA-methyltransferase (adenine-specific)
MAQTLLDCNPSSSPTPVELQEFLGSIHCEDCVAGLRRVPNDSIDLVFADPPFNIGYEYDEYDDRLDEQKYLDWCSEWMSEIRRVLKPDGAFWLAIGDEYAAELKVAAKKLGFHTRNWVVWYYTFGVHCHSKFTRSHAHLFYFTKDAKKFRFNFPAIAVPSARQLVYNDKRSNPSGRSPDDTWILRPQDCIDGFQPDEDTWYYPRVAGTFKERAGFHGCQMPEQLLGRIIRTCTEEGDVVIDPFSGSATTLAVAKKLGRKFFGFELSKDYQARGTARISAADVGDALDGAEEPRASAPSTYDHLKSARIEDMPLFQKQLLAESKGFIEAFLASHRGFSVDRLVADPLLNQDFQSHCERLALPGSAGDRNRWLFRLRKSGQLKRSGIETTNETSFSWEQLDARLHASEVAWKRVSDLYDAGLDEIISDPRLADEFDNIAQQLSPGGSSLEYRWGAFKLRKATSFARKCDLDLHPLRPQTIHPLHRLPMTEIDEGPGVYVLMSESKRKGCVFVGETIALKRTILSLFVEQSIEPWIKLSGVHDLGLKFLPFPIRKRRSLQCAALRLMQDSLLNESSLLCASVD